MEKLKKCPFCGNNKSIVKSTADENEEVRYPPKFKCIICDATHGGCGGCGGYHRSVEKAIEAWNRRS